MKELAIDAKTENLDQVIAFVDEALEALGCPAKVKKKLELVAEEIFVNIAHYAYGGAVGASTIAVGPDEAGGSVMVFRDRGVPYNPLEKEDPDITLPAGERQIGGLGIFLTKTIADDIRYESIDGWNTLTIFKQF
jgi:anti-sigma regulatory factor (Ser/Thr protein kinase)